MRLHTHAAAALAVAALATLSSPALAQAPDTRERTKMTFDRAIEVPGATLQPGTYWFELADTPLTRHIVKIMDSSNKIITTANAVPIERGQDQIKGDTVLALNPTDNSAAAALDAWFYPGQVYGHEFVYSKAQASQIAQRTHMTILADEDGKTYRIDPSGVQQEWKADDKSKDAWMKMHAKSKKDSSSPKSKDDK